MYYVLFTWVKGTRERDFIGFRTKPELIDFLGKNFEKIIVWNIHEAATEYRFGLVEKESEPEEEGGAFLNQPDADEEKPADYLGSSPPAESKAAVEAEAERESKKHPLLKDRKEEPSAMEKIADKIDEEKKEDLTEAEILKKNKQALKRAEVSMEAAKKEQNGSKETWRICSKCNKNRISPVNKKGICTPCQLKRKTDRPYKRRAKF
jgi:hypothetical protein